jgi:hypothetical protein
VTKRIALAATTFLIGALALTGCGQLGEETNADSGGHEIRYVEVTTPHGTVPCLVYQGYRKGGLDCDWERVR